MRRVTIHQIVNATLNRDSAIVSNIDSENLESHYFLMAIRTINQTGAARKLLRSASRLSATIRLRSS